MANTITTKNMSLTLESHAGLNNGVEIPILGLGVYQSPPGKTSERAVSIALKIGYRHIDTASLYGNESDVGKALRQSGLRREEVFITTKVWNSEQGYDTTLQACERSLGRLGLAYVDLYLIHWPVQGKSKETWKAMNKILQQGKARAIGVSNYTIRDLQEILQYSKDIVVIPAVNQVEFHPFLYQNELLQFCEKINIQLEAYSPLTRAKRLNHPTIVEMAKKYGKTPAQILIRWSLQHDVVVIPKSIHEDRIRENSQVFDFHLQPDDMKLLDSLNENLQTVFLD
ncbi:MAG: aldo/keto reductase [Candidatus Nitrosopolaris sp.]|jgi:methylglyoxal/glyoxal reductase